VFTYEAKWRFNGVTIPFYVVPVEQVLLFSDSTMKNRCDTFIFTTLPDNWDTYSQSKLVWFLAHCAALLTDY